FMMVRVSGLRRQRTRGALEAPPDRMTPTEQLTAIRQDLTPLLEEASRCWSEDILPGLNRAGILIHRHQDLGPDQKRALEDFFEQEVFPVLTPLAFDVGHPFPFVSGLSLNLAVIINDPEHGTVFSRLKVPLDILQRLIRVPGDILDADDPESLSGANAHHFIFLEDLVAANLDRLYPGVEVVAAYPFRITRDADFEIEEDEASDLLTAIEGSVELRRIGEPIRLEADSPPEPDFYARGPPRHGRHHGTCSGRPPGPERPAVPSLLPARPLRRRGYLLHDPKAGHPALPSL
ncbi:MAG: Polyphosphate kinase, partial [Methanoculleus marisnigri]